MVTGSAIVAIAFLDSRVARITEAIRAAGMADRGLANAENTRSAGAA